MSRHTPGPWEIIGEDDLPEHDDLVVVAFDVSGSGTMEEPPSLFICNIGSGGGHFHAFAPVDADENWPVSLANAKLIAAAPELLASLKTALVMFENCDFRNGVGEFGADEGEVGAHRIIREMEALVAKAEGKAKP